MLYGIFGAIACFVAGISVLIRHKLDFVSLEMKKHELVKLLKNLPLWRENTESKVDSRAKEGSADDDKKGIVEVKKMEEGQASMKEPEKPDSGKATYDRGDHEKGCWGNLG